MKLWVTKAVGPRLPPSAPHTRAGEGAGGGAGGGSAARAWAPSAPQGPPRAPQPCVGCFDSAPGAELRQTTPHWTPFKLLQALKLGLEPERKY